MGTNVSEAHTAYIFRTSFCPEINWVQFPARAADFSLLHMTYPMGTGALSLVVK
jgi:hypothetical protein